MAAQVLDPIKCGDCGNERFTLTHVAPKGTVRLGGDPHVKGHIEAVCTKCHAKTKISVQASLTVDGSACGGWK